MNRSQQKAIFFRIRKGTLGNNLKDAKVTMNQIRDVYPHAMPFGRSNNHLTLKGENPDMVRANLNKHNLSQSKGIKHIQIKGDGI
jgi:hypothetical protein